MRKTCFSLSFLLTYLSMATVVYPQPDDLKWSRGPSRLYPVTKWDADSRTKRIGFIDNTGKLVIDYDRLPRSTLFVGEFHEGRAVIYLDAARPPGLPACDVGFIDETGNMVIAPRFLVAHDFSEGLAYVQGNDFNGFIDLQGRPVIKTGYFARDFHEGLAAVSSTTNVLLSSRVGGPWGFVDRTGKMVIQQQYGFADDFSEGLAGVVVDRKFGFINQKGEMVIPPRFTPRRSPYSWNPLVATSRFSEGLAPVTTDPEFELGKGYGYINRKGDFVIPPQFFTAQLFSEGLALVVQMEPTTHALMKVGWIDKSGQWVVTEVQRYVPADVFSKKFFDPRGYQDWRYSEGLVSFRFYSDAKVLNGYMDRKGSVVIEPRESIRVGPFVGGLALVHVKGFEGYPEEDYGYINKQGEFVWRSTYIVRSRALRGPEPMQ